MKTQIKGFLNEESAKKAAKLHNGIVLKGSIIETYLGLLQTYDIEI